MSDGDSNISKEWLLRLGRISDLKAGYTLVRLAEALDVRPSEIVGRMEEMLPKWCRPAR